MLFYQTKTRFVETEADFVTLKPVNYKLERIEEKYKFLAKTKQTFLYYIIPLPKTRLGGIFQIEDKDWEFEQDFVSKLAKKKITFKMLGNYLETKEEFAQEPKKDISWLLIGAIITGFVLFAMFSAPSVNFWFASFLFIIFAFCLFGIFVDLKKDWDNKKAVDEILTNL